MKKYIPVLLVFAMLFTGTAFAAERPTAIGSASYYLNADGSGSGIGELGFTTEGVAALAAIGLTPAKALGVNETFELHIGDEWPEGTFWEEEFGIYATSRLTDIALDFVNDGTVAMSYSESKYQELRTSKSYDFAGTVVIVFPYKVVYAGTNENITVDSKGTVINVTYPVGDDFQILCAVEEAPTKPTFATTITYSDVPEDAWYYEAVYGATALGYFEGDGTGRFNPNNTITRQELAQVVCRVIGKDTGAGGSDNWWAYKAVKNGIESFLTTTDGDGTGSYDISSRDHWAATVTRAEAINSFAAGMYGAGMYDETKPAATRWSIPDYNTTPEAYRQYICFAYGQEFIHGVDIYGTLNPNATLTRAEFAQIIYNALSK